MAQILLKYDNRLKKPDIIVGLHNTSKEEAGEYYKENKFDIQQTSVYGVEAPIIQIGDIFVDPVEIIDFELKSTGPLPELYFSIEDRHDNLKRLQTPGLDNEIVISILPPFDNAYKKIKLLFYVSNFSTSGNKIFINGSYKNSKLLSSSFKSFGQLSTYQLFDTIAKETDLGFATNTEDNEEDMRYMYCNHISYLELLQTEIIRSKSCATNIYDWWVDLWDNINYVDIYERNNAIDKEEDMMIWVSGQSKEMYKDFKTQPHQVPAVLNNHPADSQMELFFHSYELINNTGSQIGNGTDRVFSVYSDLYKEYSDFLLQDGDTKNDIFYRFDYLGEIYGEYNYLLSEKCREMYIQKMGLEKVKIKLHTPMISLMRGSKVNALFYYNDSSQNEFENSLKENNLYIDNPSTQIPLNFELSEEEAKKYNTTDGEFKIDKSISGQYFICGVIIRFNHGSWSNELILSRPNVYKPKILRTE